MATQRAIDKLKKAFNVSERSSYSIYKGDEVVLTVYWTPITIADRDTIHTTLRAMKKSEDDGSLEFALQVIVKKAEDKEGNRLFNDGDIPALKRELPISILLDLMTKIQDMDEGANPDAVKSATEE